MPLSWLRVEHLRRLNVLELEPVPGLNLVTGPNASGKTSLLEAIYLLGRGRSFRGARPSEAISRDASGLRVVGRVQREQGGSLTLGVERDAGGVRARVAGEPVRALAELAVHLPLLLLSPESHRLLEAGPRQRRRFLDWGVFHDSTAFLDLWRRFRIALRQRNSALRAAAPAQVVGAWDPELRQCAQGMDALRQAYAVRLEAAVSSLAADMLALDDLSLTYRRGWDARQDYGELLAAGYEQDSHCGYTRMGPHRADLQLRAGGRAAISWVSRGQQKMLVAAMIIAQAGLYAEHHGAHCLLLVDDLASELDRRHREALLSALQRSRAQLFVTTIEPGLLDCSQWSQHRTFRLDDGALVV